MEITFDPKIEATLERIASETGRGPNQVVVDLVTAQLEYDAWFRGEVEAGLASLDRGEYVEDDEVDARIDRLLK